MSIKRIWHILPLALVLLAAPEAGAQVMMERAVVAPGGGRTSSTTMTMDLTIGDAVVGQAASATTAGQFGFWTNAFSVSSVSAPELGAGAVSSLRVTPNPVATAGSVEVTLARSTQVDVVVYDAEGRKGWVLYSGARSAGSFSIPFDPSSLASGTYFVVVSVPGGLMQQPVTVVR